MRLNAYKICRARRRPLAQKTGGIGVWTHVLHIVSVIGILTNCSLVALTSHAFHPILKAYGNLGLFGVIVGWEHIMLLIKYLMQSHCSPYPKSVLDDMKREGQEKKKKRNSSLRAKEERKLSHYSGYLGRECSDPQLSPHCEQSFKNGGVGYHLKSDNSIPSIDQPETSPLISRHYDVKVKPTVASKNRNSRACGTKLQQLRGNKVQRRKSLTPKLNTQKFRLADKIDHVEMKTPKRERQTEPYEYSTERVEADDHFIDSPFNNYHRTDYKKSPRFEQPDFNADEDNNSISDLLGFGDGQFNNDSYDESFENNKAEQRIETRLSEIEKRKSKNL